MIVRLKKETIIEMLESESEMVQTAWVDWESSIQAKISETPCVCCAVGTIVRKCMYADATVAEVIKVCLRNASTMVNGPFGELSDVFESKVDANLGRKAAIQYVREQFADEVELDLGEFAAREELVGIATQGGEKHEEDRSSDQ